MHGSLCNDEVIATIVELFWLTLPDKIYYIFLFNFSCYTEAMQWIWTDWFPWPKRIEKWWKMNIRKYVNLRLHNGLITGIKRTTTFWFASLVKTLSDSIFPCNLQLKHIKWQIFINFIFLSQFHYFISFWWVYVQFKLQG